MKSAGQILKSAREHQNKTLDDVSAITKIRLEFLNLIELDDYTKLPSGTIARGFIRNYAEFLHLNPTQVLAIFRRDFLENQRGQIIPRGMVDPVTKANFWTPKTTLLAGVTLIFTLFVAYLVFQYRILVGPPPLTLTEPKVSTTIESTIEVSGSTDPESTISVNGQLVALEKGGKFAFRLSLIEGENIISVTATNKFGKTKTLTKTITRK
jgi:cytoskeletal protein RodZ